MYKKEVKNSGNHPLGVDIVTLGCSKNLVDSERLLALLRKAGFDARHEDASKADIVIVNTCGFIGDAKEESVNTILQFARLRADEKIKGLFVMGCLSERYRKELRTELPEVDGWYGKFDWTTLADDLTTRYGKQSSTAGILCPTGNRVLATPPHTAYLKIAEGCNRHCAFCAIPIITGRYQSRPIEQIIDEAHSLAASGVTELNVIAQDLSAYGTDLYGKSKLAELTDRLSDVDGIRWIRLHYAYPAGFPLDLLDVMARRENVCKYIDIALQHISDKVLAAMHRRITADETRRLLDEMRSRVPDLHIRTTLMTGFPGEGEREFEELMQFVADQRFERMGAFTYCEEEGTPAAKLYKDDIPQKVKQMRLDRLMSLQEGISLEHQEKKVGTVITSLIDREEEDYYIGRSQWDSPEVDPEILIAKTTECKPGDYKKVKITQALPFELMAEPID